MMLRKMNSPIAEQSRTWLINSLLKLMEEKKYSTITVSEIAEYADLSRRTFYRIFNSKEEVLQQYFLSICEEYVSCFDKNSHYTLKKIVEIYFSFWENHINFLMLIQKNHLFYFLLEGFNETLPLLHNMIRKDLYSNKKEETIALLAGGGALWNILEKWIQYESRPSPKEMSEIIVKIIQINL